jgi:hypothetical protein
MPKMLCRCGNILRYGDIPNPIEWLMISDLDFDTFTGTVNTEEVYSSFTHALHCPQCSRLWIFWKGFAEDPQLFVPEKE